MLFRSIHLRKTVQHLPDLHLHPLNAIAHLRGFVQQLLKQILHLLTARPQSPGSIRQVLNAAPQLLKRIRRLKNIVPKMLKPSLQLPQPIARLEFQPSIIPVPKKSGFVPDHSISTPKKLARYRTGIETCLFHRLNNPRKVKGSG